MNIHRLRVVDYDAPVRRCGDSVITECDEDSSNSKRDGSAPKTMLDSKHNTSEENGSGDQNATSNSADRPSSNERCIRQRRSKSELFRLPSQLKLKKYEQKNTSSSEDLKKYKKNDRSNHRKRYNLDFNKDSILNLLAKGGDVKSNKKQDNSKDETNVKSDESAPKLSTRVNRSRHKCSTSKRAKDTFGFKQKNRQFDPCLYQMSCHFLDIDNHSAINMLRKRFRSKHSRKRQKQQNEKSKNDKCKHHQVKVLYSDLPSPDDDVEKYYNLTDYESSHRGRTHNIFKDTWRRKYANFNFRKDANVFVSSSALIPKTKYRVERACGGSRHDISQAPSSLLNKKPVTKTESVTSEGRKFVSGLVNSITASKSNLPKKNTTKISMKNIFMGLLVIVWSPCLLAVILALIIMSPWRVPNLLGHKNKSKTDPNASLFEKCKPKCFVHECQRICSSYSKTQQKSVLSSVASWFTRLAGTAATSYHAMLSLVKLNKGPICAGSSFAPKGCKYPNPKTRYNLYYANNRGWVMKPVHRSQYHNMRCEYTPKMRRSSPLCARLKKKRSSEVCCTSKDMILEVKPSKPKVECSCSDAIMKNKGDGCCCTSTDMNLPATYPCSPKKKQVNIKPQQNSSRFETNIQSNALCNCRNQQFSAYKHMFQSDKTSYAPLCNFPHYCVGMVYGVNANYHCRLHNHRTARTEQKTKDTHNEQKHQTTSFDKPNLLYQHSKTVENAAVMLDAQQTNNVKLIDKELSYSPPTNTDNQIINNRKNLVDNASLIDAVADHFNSNLQPIKSPLFKRDSKSTCAIKEQSTVPTNTTVQPTQLKTTAFVNASKFCQTKQSSFITKTHGTMYPSKTELKSVNEKKNKRSSKLIALLNSSLHDPKNKNKLKLLAKLANCPCKFNDQYKLPLCKRGPDYVYKKDQFKLSLNKIVPFIKGVARSPCIMDKINKVRRIVAKGSEKTNQTIPCKLCASKERRNDDGTVLQRPNNSKKVGASQTSKKKVKYASKFMDMGTSASLTKPSGRKANQNQSQNTTRREVIVSEKSTLTADEVKCPCDIVTRNKSSCFENKDTKNKHASQLLEKVSKYARKTIESSTSSLLGKRRVYSNLTKLTITTPSLEKVIKSETKETNTSLSRAKLTKCFTKQTATTQSLEIMAKLDKVPKSNIKEITTTLSLEKLNKRVTETKATATTPSLKTIFKAGDSFNRESTFLGKLTDQSRKSGFGNEIEAKDIPNDKSVQCPCIKKDAVTSPSPVKAVECKCTATGKDEIKIKASDCACKKRHSKSARKKFDEPCPCILIRKSGKICLPSDKGSLTNTSSQIEDPCFINKTLSLPKVFKCACQSKGTNTLVKQTVKCGCKTKVTKKSRSRKKASKCECKTIETNTSPPHTKNCACITGEIAKQLSDKACSVVPIAQPSVISPRHSKTLVTEKAVECGCRTQSPSRKRVSSCACKVGETQTKTHMQKSDDLCPCELIHLYPKSHATENKTEITKTPLLLEKATECECKEKVLFEKATECECTKMINKSQSVKRDDFVHKAVETKTSDKACPCDIIKKCSPLCKEVATETTASLIKTIEKVMVQPNESPLLQNYLPLQKTTEEAKPSNVTGTGLDQTDLSKKQASPHQHFSKDLIHTKKISDQMRHQKPAAPTNNLKPSEINEKQSTHKLIISPRRERQSLHDQSATHTLKKKRNQSSSMSPKNRQPKVTEVGAPREAKIPNRSKELPQTIPKPSMSPKNRIRSKVSKNGAPRQTQVPGSAKELPQAQSLRKAYPEQKRAPQKQIKISDNASPTESLISLQRALHLPQDQSTPKVSRTLFKQFSPRMPQTYNRPTRLKNPPLRIISQESVYTRKKLLSKSKLSPKHSLERTKVSLKLHSSIPPKKITQKLDDEPSTSRPYRTRNQVKTRDGLPLQLFHDKCGNCWCSDEELSTKRFNDLHSESICTLRDSVVNPNKINARSYYYNFKTRFSQYNLRSVPSQTSIRTIIRSCHKSIAKASLSSQLTANNIRNFSKRNRVLKNNYTNCRKYLRSPNVYEYSSDLLNKSSIYRKNSSQSSKISLGLPLLTKVRNSPIIASSFGGNELGWISKIPTEQSQRSILKKQFGPSEHHIRQHSHEKSHHSKSTQLHLITPRYIKAEKCTGLSGKHNKHTKRRKSSKCIQTSKHSFFMTGNRSTKRLTMPPSLLQSHLQKLRKTMLLKDKSQQTFSQSLSNNQVAASCYEQGTGMSGLRISVRSKQSLPKHSNHNLQIESRSKPAPANNLMNQASGPPQNIAPIQGYLPLHRSQYPPDYVAPYTNILGPIVPTYREGVETSQQVGSSHSFGCPLSKQNDPCFGTILRKYECPTKEEPSRRVECECNKQKPQPKQQNTQTVHSIQCPCLSDKQIDCECNSKKHQSAETHVQTETKKKTSKDIDCECPDRKSSLKQKSDHLQTEKEKTRLMECTCYGKDQPKRQSKANIEYKPGPGAPLIYGKKKAKIEILPSKGSRHSLKENKFNQAALERCLEKERQKLNMKQKRVKDAMKKGEQDQNVELTCWERLVKEVRESEEQAWPLERPRHFQAKILQPLDEGSAPCCVRPIDYKPAPCPASKQVPCHATIAPADGEDVPLRYRTPNRDNLPRLKLPAVKLPTDKLAKLKMPDKFLDMKSKLMAKKGELTKKDESTYKSEVKVDKQIEVPGETPKQKAKREKAESKELLKADKKAFKEKSKFEQKERLAELKSKRKLDAQKLKQDSKQKKKMAAEKLKEDKIKMKLKEKESKKKQLIEAKKQKELDREKAIKDKRKQKMASTLQKKKDRMKEKMEIEEEKKKFKEQILKDKKEAKLQKQKLAQEEKKKMKAKRKKEKEKRIPGYWDRCIAEVVAFDKRVFPVKVTCRPMYIHTIRNKPCLFIYRICPWLYPGFLNCIKCHKDCCRMFCYCLSILLWAPIVYCCNCCFELLVCAC